MAFTKIYRKYFITTAFIWAACLVLSLVVYILVLRPQKCSEKRLEERLAEKKQLYESALEAAQRESRIQVDQEIERLKNRLEDFVADFEDSPNLTFDISQIATEKKVTSFSVKSRENHEVSAIPNCSHICESHMDIGFSAGFNQFATFLNALERHRPVLFVDTFMVTRSKQDGPGYQVSLNVAVLVRKQQDSDTTPKRLACAYGVKI